MFDIPTPNELMHFARKQPQNSFSFSSRCGGHGGSHQDDSVNKKDYSSKV